MRMRRRNTIVQVFQKGYLLNDRVLRPALVAVARPRAAPTKRATNAQEAGLIRHSPAPI